MEEHATSPHTLKARLEAYERHLILEALRIASGNQRRAAESLGVLPTTLHEKMKRLGILQRPAARAAEVAPAFVA